MNERLRKQMERKTKLTDGSSNKNDTERARNLAVLALILLEIC